MLSLNFIRELLIECYYVFSFLQGLNISSETGYTHEASIIDLEDPLEVGVDGHQLSGETGVSCDGYAVLAGHSHHHVAVVVEDRLY